MKIEWLMHFLLVCALGVMCLGFYLIFSGLSGSKVEETRHFNGICVDVVATKSGEVRQVKNAYLCPAEAVIDEDKK